jgi:hypothetical protein
MVNKRSLLIRFTAYLHEHHPDVQSFSQLQRYPHIELESMRRDRVPAKPANYIALSNV